MAQDRKLELAQDGARLEAELLVEHPARLPIGLERLGLAAAPVEGEDQVAAQTLAQAVAGDEAGELGDELAVVPQLEVGLEPVLECGEAQLLQRGRLGVGERGVEPVERDAAPERVCLAEQARPLRRVGGCAGLREERAEALQVELAGLDPGWRSGRRRSAADGTPASAGLRAGRPERAPRARRGAAHRRRPRSRAGADRRGAPAVALLPAGAADPPSMPRSVRGSESPSRLLKRDGTPHLCGDPTEFGRK